MLKQLWQLLALNMWICMLPSLLLDLLLTSYRYIIHAPYGGKEARCGAWRALVEAQRAGKVRSIGVSNYGVHHLEELKQYIGELEKEGGEGSGGKISVGQWELHPWLARRDITEWCKKNGVLCQAYSPLARGQRMGEPILSKLGEKYGKSPAQILVRWSLQKASSKLL
jgi:diketogulonate reductase-like aldo/keto reductase